jgi:hypothetical protein
MKPTPRKVLDGTSLPTLLITNTRIRVAGQSDTPGTRITGVLSDSKTQLTYRPTYKPTYKPTHRSAHYILSGSF